MADFRYGVRGGRMTLQIRLDVTERYWLNRENASIQRLLWQAVPPQEMQEESGMPVFQPGNLPVG